MTILSVVAFLFSIQQLWEAEEEVTNKIADLEKKVAYQNTVLQRIDAQLGSASAELNDDDKGTLAKSKMIFAAGLIVLIVGLTLDYDFENSAIANTATIFSFSFIFWTMAYKELYSARIDKINEERYEADQKIIASLTKKVHALELTQNYSESR